MNQVSWLIYIAGVAGNLGGLLILTGFIVSILAVVYFFCSVNYEREIKRWNSEEHNLNLLKSVRRTRRFVPTLITLAFVLWTSAALCPSSDTVLAIAASQFGEQLLHTPTANLAEQALNSWLRRQITPAPVTPDK